jgi:hypothetical protein
MYLQAITMSDLALADGDTLDPDMLLGRPGTRSSTSSWIHINQARPHEASWKIWRRATSQWSTNNKLSQTLGAWQYPADKLRRRWPSYYDHASGELYVRHEQVFTRCNSVDAIRFAPLLEVDWRPRSTSIPVQARRTIQGKTWILLLPAPPIPTPTSNPISATFLVFLSSLEPWERELFPELSMEVDCYKFLELVDAQALDAADTRLPTVSDGSDDSDSMSFGWVIALLNGTRLARYSGPAYGLLGSSF